MERSNKTVKICVRGGLIQDITDIPADVTIQVIDYDIDDESTELEMVDGALAFVAEWQSDKYPEPVYPPVQMILGECHFNCSEMPCWTKNRQQDGCVMDGCEDIMNMIRTQGVIVGMQVLKEALYRWEPGFDMATLLDDTVYRREWPERIHR